jgi:hypothetical protein
MVAQNDGWAVGNMGTIVHWNGTQWRTVASPTATNLLSVAMANDDSGWAVGKAGTIVRWNGTAWSREPSPTEEDLLSVHMLNEDTGWAVGGDGTVIHYNGAVWELASSPTDAILSSVFAPDEENVWVVGVGGSILKWTGRDQAQRIMVDPPSLDYGAVPVDYPSLWNFTRIANPGTEPLNVESVTLVEDGAGVFSLLGAIVDELLVGPEFGDPSRLGPFTLGPGGDLSIWINYQTITADIEDYQGRIEIVSDDPFEPVVEVELLASSTTASGASIYYRQEVLYRSEVDRPFFSAQVDMDATVTGWEVFNDQNVEDCTARVSEDTSLVIVEGKVKDPDYYARMTLEVTYENSSEKLAIVDILISPYLATKASIETCDSTGNPKDDFDPGERVYLSGKGLAASTEYVVSIVPDSDIWITGMPIKGIPDVSSRLSSDEEGAIPPAALWDTIQSDGEYDILLDINGNGLYDGGVDPIDNSDDGSTGGFAIPELLIVSALLTLLRVHLSKFRRADPREPTC